VFSELTLKLAAAWPRRHLWRGCVQPASVGADMVVPGLGSGNTCRQAGSAGAACTSQRRRPVEQSGPAE